MQSLLGKITHITPRNETPQNGGAAALEIKLKAACVLPQRTKIPEWLKDQTLTLRREVADPREIGGPGDSIVLTPAEAAAWLYPLTATPGVAYGEVPRTLRVHLRWWKDDKPPEYTVRANGRSQSGPLAKEGEAYAASVDTAAFWDAPPSLPVAFEVTCDKLKVACSVLPTEEPYARKLVTAEGERHRVENAWYVVDVIAQSDAGGIFSLREKGREVDHFRRPENVAQYPLQYGGHCDWLRTGWQWPETMLSAKMTSAGGRREGNATRLDLEGVLDEGQNLRTSVAYTLYDALPLLLIQRDFRFGKGKATDGDTKEKEEKPKEPIDDLKPIELGFRAAWIAERDGHTGSRVLCTDGQRLAVNRCVAVGDDVWSHNWRMADGWVIAEHPRRRESMLYLFDPGARPQLGTWITARSMALHLHWPCMPVRPEESVGYTLALTAGERCGAGVGGAWVASRTALPGGGTRCAIIARLRVPDSPPTAIFALGGETRETPLQELMLPGVGRCLSACVEFPGGRRGDPFDVTVAGIPARR